MTSSTLSWPEAIIRVLEDAGEPLHYQEITKRIGSQGLRDFSSSRTPANTTSARLNSMTKSGDPLYDRRVSKVSAGVYEFVDPSQAEEDTEEQTGESEDGQLDEEREHLVPAFGLYWERNKVLWNRNRILGRQTPDAEPVNFADQQGVYLLHNRRSIVYVGRTTDSLYGRLKSHTAGRRAYRWDEFSWFGLRSVDDEGNLRPLVSEVSLEDLITTLESVLIEALEPPSNSRRGDRMGELYDQVPDPEIQQRQRYEILAALGSELQGLVPQQ